MSSGCQRRVSLITATVIRIFSTHCTCKQSQSCRCSISLSFIQEHRTSSFCLLWELWGDHAAGLAGFALRTSLTCENKRAATNCTFPAAFLGSASNRRLLVKVIMFLHVSAVVEGHSLQTLQMLILWDWTRLSILHVGPAVTHEGVLV